VFDRNEGLILQLIAAPNTRQPFIIEQSIFTDKLTLTRGVNRVVPDPALPTTVTARLYGLPDLRRYRYIDIVSSQLTYNQDLKDAATTQIVRDILCRWYFAYDQFADVDQYGFPIFMGYEPFVVRRTFSPPKQIRWDNIQPIGQLSFEVYDDNQNQILIDSPQTNFLMTLQVSEN
jgi:hypothetical protein